MRNKFQNKNKLNCYYYHFLQRYICSTNFFKNNNSIQIQNKLILKPFNEFHFNSKTFKRIKKV